MDATIQFQGPPVQGPYQCERCGKIEDHFYQTIEKFGENRRTYVCSAACYNRYHKNSQTFQQTTAPLSARTVWVKAQVSVSLAPTPEAPEEEQPGAAPIPPPAAAAPRPETWGEWFKRHCCCCC